MGFENFAGHVYRLVPYQGCEIGCRHASFRCGIEIDRVMESESGDEPDPGFENCLAFDTENQDLGLGFGRASSVVEGNEMAIESG